MEVSPRAGGNRIAELQRRGTGIDLIEAEVLKAVGEPLPTGISMPRYDACYVNDIIHSRKAGAFQGVVFDKDFQEKYVIDACVYPSKGDAVEAFRGANNAVGSIFLRFADRDECDRVRSGLSNYIKVAVE